MKLHTHEQKDERVGQKGEHAPEGIYIAARAFRHANTTTVVAQHKRRSDDSDDCREMQDIRDPINAIGGYQGNSGLQNRVIDALQSLADKKACNRAKQNAAA